MVTSLINEARLQVSIVAVGEAVFVGVLDGVHVTVGDDVSVGVLVGVLDGVQVAVGDGVSVEVLVGV